MSTRNPTRRTSLRLQPLEDRAQPSAGALDPTFDTDGVAVTAMGSNYLNGRDLVIQPDGKIVVAGSRTGTGVDADFVVARYRADGSLDPTFGTGGMVTTDILRRNNYAAAVGLQPDGKIVVAGQTNNSRTNEWLATLVRYHPNGTVDTTFGGAAKGKVTTEVVTANTQEPINDLVIQPDGKIVAVGETNGQAFVLRYQSNGTLDPTFDGDGRVVLPLDGARHTQAFGLARQPDGKIVIGHRPYGPGPNGDRGVAQLVRLNPNGSLDPSFGSGGRVTNERMDAGAPRVVVQGDGKLVAVGDQTGVAGGAAVARYNPDGSPDTGFGDDLDGDGVRDGMTVPTFPGGTVRGSGGLGVVIDGSGRIVYAGRNTHPVDPANPEGLWESDFGIARLNPDGSPDTTFGAGGATMTNYSVGADDWHAAVGLQGDGKIVAAGTAQDQVTGRYRFAVARYLGDPPAGAAGVAGASGRTADGLAADGLFPLPVPAPERPTRSPVGSSARGTGARLPVLAYPAPAVHVLGGLAFAPSPVVGWDQLVPDLELLLS